MLLTLVLQGGGAAATLLAALWLGARLGPQQQGQFNQLKALVEFGAALSMLGMPQALYVYAQQARLTLAQARHIAARVAWLGLPVGALAAWFSLPGVGVGVGVAPVLALALAVALASLHGQWRTLLLLRQHTLGFNLVTVAPQWLLLALAATVVLAQGLGLAGMAVLMVVVWGLSAVLAGQMLGLGPVAPDPQQSPSGQPAVPVQGLVRHGAATWLTASLATASVVVLQSAAQAAAGGEGLGQISLALMLAQVPLTPLNYALPLLLRHRLMQGASPALTRAALLAMAAMALLALLVAGLGDALGNLGLGAGYGRLHRPLAWLLLAGAAETLLRLLSVDAQACGQAWRSTAAEALRLAVLLAAAATLVLPGPAFGLGSPVEALAMAWAVAAALAALLLHWLSGRA